METDLWQLTIVIVVFLAVCIAIFLVVYRDPVSVGAAVGVAVVVVAGISFMATRLLEPWGGAMTRAPEPWGDAMPRAPPASPPVGDRQTLVQPVWNAWAERTLRVPARTDPLPPAFAPTTLLPLQDYTVVINLAAMEYPIEQTGLVFSTGGSTAFREWLAETLDENPDANIAKLTMVALTDPDYFTLDANVKTFAVDLAKIRKAKRDGVVVPASPFEYLRDHNGEAPFSFGLQSFVVRTGERVGNGTIAISIWADGKPVDELALTLCIVGPAINLPCRGNLSLRNPLAGVDLTMRGVYPDFALHLIDVKKSVKGVLRCNSCGWGENDYPQWDLEETADWVADRIKEITAAIGGVAGADMPLDQARPIIENAGDDLYNVIFHARKTNNEAMKAFKAFMTRAQAAEKDGAPPLSLFVRIIPDRPKLTLAPIGLMRAQPENGPADFVGFVADIQTPLEYQYYSETRTCLSQWVLFVPPEEPKGKGFKAVLKARGEFEGWIRAFQKTCPGCVIEEENTFHKWLNQSAPPEQRAVAILSHHAANALYFNEFSRSPQVLSSAVWRRFANPSFVLLNACGTSEPGASEFIRQFNYNGVNSAIATSTLVDPVLAGKFLTEFMDQLKRNVNDKGYTVSRARFDAVRSLGRSANSVYGPKALAFILTGNGAIRLCVPDK